MGMYTELYLDCKIDTSKMSKTEKSIITYMFDKDESILELDTPTLTPNNDLFKCSRWDVIGRGRYAYFDDDINCSLIKDGNIWTIINRSDFKNYDNEIELFIKWISSYIIKENEEQYIGYYRYEECDEETDIYV